MSRLIACLVAAWVSLPAFAQPAPRPNRIVHEVPDSTFWPEAVDYDPRTRSYFLGSVRRGTIMRIDSAGRTSTFWAPAGRVGATIAVRVDTARRVLWATMSGIPERGDYLPADSGIAEIMEIGLDDARVRRRWNLPAAPKGHVLGDLAIGPRGDVFITDSRQPELYRIRPGRDSVETIRDSLFRSLQGAAPAPDGSALYLADYSRGLLRLDLRSGEVTRVTDGATATFRGCDGLLWYRGSLIALHNGRLPGHVYRLGLDVSGRTVTSAEVIDIDPAMADEPTVGTIVGDELVFVGTSQWEKRDSAGRLKPDAKLRGIVLVGITLK